MKETFILEIYQDGLHKKARFTNKNYFLTRIQKFPVGKCRVVIEDTKPKRSGQQNRYLWGVYYPQIIEQGFGTDSAEDLHEHFKRKFLGREYFSVNGEEYYRYKSSKDLNKSDFSIFIMNIEAESGVKAPPTEDWFNGSV